MPSHGHNDMDVADGPRHLRVAARQPRPCLSPHAVPPASVSFASLVSPHATPCGRQPWSRHKEDLRGRAPEILGVLEPQHPLLKPVIVRTPGALLLRVTPSVNALRLWRLQSLHQHFVLVESYTSVHTRCLHDLRLLQLCALVEGSFVAMCSQFVGAGVALGCALPNEANQHLTLTQQDGSEPLWRAGVYSSEVAQRGLHVETILDSRVAYVHCIVGPSSCITAMNPGMAPVQAAVRQRNCANKSSSRTQQKLPAAVRSGSPPRAPVPVDTHASDANDLSTSLGKSTAHVNGLSLIHI